jgi:hypothetical protein
MGRLCLIASDVLKAVEATHVPKPGGAVAWDAWFTTVAIPMADPAIGDGVLARARSLWIDSQQDQAVQREAKRIGLRLTFEEAFREAHGVGLNEFMLIGLTVYIQFVQNAVSSPSTPLRFDPTKLAPLFGDLDFKRALGLLSSTADQLAARLLGTRQSWATDFTPLRDRPLLEFEEGKFACLDLGLFAQFFLEGESTGSWRTRTRPASSGSCSATCSATTLSGC